MRNTALQVTNFNFYGDDLIALQDNATGEIYAAINHLLRNIGFTERQTKHIHKKWSEDIVVSKGVQNFVLPLKNGNQSTSCISNRKLPVALTKITITPKMRKEQPELSRKLELYQDKCADVLATVFIDKKESSLDIQPILDTLTKFADNTTSTLSAIDKRISILEESQFKKQLPERKYSRWKTNTFSKLNTLLSYVNENSDESLKLSEIIHLVIGETEDTYDIDLNDYVDAYKSEYGLDENPYAIDVINHYKDIRDMFTLTLDSITTRLHIQNNTDKTYNRNIFDVLAAKLETEKANI